MGKNDFDVPSAIRKVEDDNAGVNFYRKVKEAICDSTSVQDEIKKVVWALLHEKIVWAIVAVSSFVGIGLLKELASKLISKI